MPEAVVRLDQLIDKQSNENPERIAVKHGSNNIDYKTLNERSGQLALFLSEKNIGKGDVVAVAVNRSHELVILLLAIIKSGATYLPIDIKLPANRIQYMLDDCKARLLIASESFHQETKTDLDTVIMENVWAEIKAIPVDQYKCNPDADSIAYILYTSGSTGKPKGVQVKHSGLLNLLLSMQESPGMRSSDILLATTTISFDIAELEIFLPLICGGKLIVADHETARDGRVLLETIQSEGVTIIQGTPTMWINMIESGWNDPLTIKILCGGEAMSRDLAKKLVPRCSSLWNMYGPTETTIWSTIKHITAADQPITIGKPIRETTVYILDEQQNQVADGEVGEIYIGGTGVALGYVNKPDLTAERFVADRFSGKNERIYKTGDLGRFLPNGEIECMGRIDHQIKIRGYRIETEEIEHQLKQFENVKDALVSSFKDYLNHLHLVAYVVTANGINDANYHLEWKEELKKTLPEYMIPDLFKIIPAMPLMANGKIDRKALPEPVIQENINTDYESAHTQTELSLTRIFLRKVALDKIGINDNFFELGIDSLVAVQIMVQIEWEFNKRIPLSALIQYPTIKKFAAFLDDKEPGTAYKTLVPIHTRGDKIPLYIVHGIGLNILNLQGMIANLSPDQPVYGIQALGLDGTAEPLDKMEDIAKFYVGEIVRHNSDGPYAITGYSFGGYIAYEMAAQLIKMGKQVVLLGMFDTNLQNIDSRQTMTEKYKTKILRQFHKINFRGGTLRKQPGPTLRYLKSYYKIKMHVFLNNVGLAKAYNPDRLPDFMLETIDKLETAFANYEFRPLDVKIELFKAEKRLYHVDDGQFYGWRKYALKGVSVHPVPGDHKGMFSYPNNRILAHKLQKKLDEINVRELRLAK
ncbi:MAG: amino acid adenylation domain-containing protein [Puia sp.]|nr:amino acid adenylation domain-containing protein [Puia sp.]